MVFIHFSLELMHIHRMVHMQHVTQEVRQGSTDLRIATLGLCRQGMMGPLKVHRYHEAASTLDHQHSLVDSG